MAWQAKTSARAQRKGESRAAARTSRTYGTLKSPPPLGQSESATDFLRRAAAGGAPVGRTRSPPCPGAVRSARGAVRSQAARPNASITARTGAAPHRRSDWSKTRGGRPAAAGRSSSSSGNSRVCLLPRRPAAGRPARPLPQGRAASARGARGPRQTAARPAPGARRRPSCPLPGRQGVAAQAPAGRFNFAARRRGASPRQASATLEARLCTPARRAARI